MIQYEVESVCFDPWAEKVRRYWRYLGGGDLYVLLGKPEGYVLLISQPHPVTGETIHGMLVSEPLILPEYRNLLWHEMGHLRGEQSDSPVDSEFLADKWAMDLALKKGFTLIAEEIILRCADFTGDESVNVVYRDAADKIITHFIDFAKSVLKKHGSQ